MKYKAILFDLDGTLLDTIEDLADSMNAALSGFGFPAHDVDTHKHLVGDGVESFARGALPEGHRDDATVVRCICAMRDEYSRRWHCKSRPYDGIPQMLDALTAGGVIASVLSNKPHDFTQLCVGKLLADWKFDIVQGVGDGVPVKPDPAGALQVACRLGIPPGEFLYLGDTDTDMQTANAAGMYAVGALWGFRAAAELKANGAKTLINHPAELLELL